MVDQRSWECFMNDICDSFIYLWITLVIYLQKIQLALVKLGRARRGRGVWKWNVVLSIIYNVESLLTPREDLNDLRSYILRELVHFSVYVIFSSYPPVSIRQTISPVRSINIIFQKQCPLILLPPLFQRISQSSEICWIFSWSFSFSWWCPDYFAAFVLVCFPCKIKAVPSSKNDFLWFLIV